MTSSQDIGPEENGDEFGGRSAALPEDPVRSDGVRGRRIAGRYEIEALLGMGSLGRTFRAVRSDDGQPVALKLLHESLRLDDDLKRRFSRDLEASRKLEHKHIARLIEHGTDDSQGPFVCRELIEGEDLVSAVRRGQLTPRRICELLIQALSAIAEAHRQGVLHRNLKPQNVLVWLEDGRECVKLCDFGNPLRVRPGAEYMAPEQGETQSIDGQADVYSVGVMLYELLTDEVPFRGSSPEETLEQHRLGAIVPPRERRPDRPLPRELEAVCLKALAKSPRERHRSPREMSQALRAVVSLLGGRADEPLGSSAFGEGRSNAAPSASLERPTMPGEQLRSRTKFWLGAAMVAAVCTAVFLSPVAQRAPATTSSAAPSPGSDLGRGGQELARGILKLQAGEVEEAVIELRNARTALGDTPEILRALGEALMIQGSRSEGRELLTRYLELEPEARDREFVQSLIRRSEQP